MYGDILIFWGMLYPGRCYLGKEWMRAGFSIQTFHSLGWRGAGRGKHGLRHTCFFGWSTMTAVRTASSQKSLFVYRGICMGCICQLIKTSQSKLRRAASAAKTVDEHYWQIPCRTCMPLRVCAIYHVENRAVYHLCKSLLAHAGWIVVWCLPGSLPATHVSRLVGLLVMSCNIWQITQTHL